MDDQTNYLIHKLYLRIVTAIVILVSKEDKSSVIFGGL